MEEKSLMRVDSVFEGEDQKIFTSLKMDTFEDKKRILKALGEADYSFDDLDGPIEVMDILVHEVDIAGEDGMTSQQKRTVLIMPNGETVSFVSNGVINGLKNLFFLFGTPPWNPAVKIKIRQAKTRWGFRTYNFELVD